MFELQIDERASLDPLHCPMFNAHGNGPRFTTLDDWMQYIPIYMLYELSALFTQFEAICADAIKAEGINVAQRPVPEAQRQAWLKVFEKAQEKKEFKLFLPFCVAIMDRLVDGLRQPDTTVWMIAELLRDFQRRMVDELRDQVHFQVHPSFVQLAKAPLAGWDAAIKAFPLIEQDVFEASYCLVADRWTASVFHQMRIMEFGLDRLRKMVRVPRKRPGWDAVIEAIDRQLSPQAGKKKSAAKRAKDRFVADAVVQLRAIKETRNTTMHDYTKSYTPNQAAEMYMAVRAFMEKMAAAA